MSLGILIRKNLALLTKTLALVAGVALVGPILSTRRELAAQSDGGVGVQFVEQIIQVQAEDDVSDAGAIFMPPKNLAKPIAIIWIHGWGVNFYQPSYVAICRDLANRGYTTISANTRMHDIGNVEAWRGDRRIRGGGYWGVTSEQVRDVTAWVNFAAKQRFKVILVGHSAGWETVLRYQVEKQDERVAGLVFASGGVHPWWVPPDPKLLAEAKQMIKEGRPDDLLRLPNRNFPSFLSAATFVDLVQTPPEFRDFFGVETTDAGIAHVHCPLLAFFGTDEEDVGNEKDLELLKSSIKRLHSGPGRVDTTTIRGADHMYAGHESNVAEAIAAWADRLQLAKPTTGENDKKP